jgi:class 3 adenylate cyclase
VGQAEDVTEHWGTGPVPGRSELRVSEADRDRAAGVLAKFCGEGRLTLEEFSDRVGVVLSARTQADLDSVMVDLPKPDVAYTSALPASGWQVSVLSGSSRKGRWRPKARFKALAFMGGLELDLRSAEIEHREITITAIAFMGGINIVVPEGVLVHLGGFSLMGGKDERIANVPILPGGPVINIRAFPFMGGVSVRTKRPRPRLADVLRRPAVGPGTGRSGGPPGAPGWDAIALGEILDQFVPREVRRRYVSGRGQRAPAPDGTVTIEFCDVSGFTELTERHGDQEAQRLLAAYFGIVRAQIRAHGGHEVKCQGDEAMIAFGGAAQAVRCAVGIQRALAERNALAETAIRAHIGLHTGEAIRDRGDFLGRTVILASRITDAAHPDEILVSAVLRELAAGSEGLSFGDPRTVELQGVSEPQQLFPVRWSGGAPVPSA